MKIGQKIVIIKGALAGEKGKMVYNGKVKFATGTWVGILLEKPGLLSLLFVERIFMYCPSLNFLL